MSYAACDELDDAFTRGPCSPCTTIAASSTPPHSCHGGLCRSTNGAACSSPVDCLSGFCADGVCCNSACAGDCGSCNAPGSVGTCVGSDAACASGCGYCAAAAADAFVCTCDLVYGNHSHVQCTAAGGTVVTVAGTSFCRLNAAACPAGWTQYLGWSTTAARTTTYANETTVTASSGGCCGAQVCSTAVAASCASGSHAWGNNGTIESRTCNGTQLTGRTGSGSCDNGSCTGNVSCTGGTNTTATAVRTQIGCY